MQREIILDTETTGFDPNEGHRIVEIGCVEVIGRVRSGKFFHTYLNPQRDVPYEAEQVHGLSTKFLQDKPLFSEKVDDFLAFIADSMLVIHNAAFDMRFLNAELKRHGFKTLPTERAFDTLLLARSKFPGAPASLDALCKRFEIDLSARDKHGALLDAELLADVYLELMGGRQVMLALEEEISAPSPINLAATAARAVLPPREFLLSDAELRAHEQLLAQIKQPLWLQ